MAHYYYVVYFDEETKEWKHDHETESVRFDGTIWNTETKEWESGYREDGTWNERQEEIDLILFDGLKYLDKLSFEREDVNGN